MTTAARARPDKTSPTMQLQVKHAPRRIPLAGIKDIAQSASDMLVDVRESMLAPHPRKNPPVFTTAQVGDLCRVDRQRMHYLARTETDLPQGTLRHSRSREFTLEKQEFGSTELPLLPNVRRRESENHRHWKFQRRR